MGLQKYCLEDDKPVFKHIAFSFYNFVYLINSLHNAQHLLCLQTIMRLTLMLAPTFPISKQLNVNLQYVLSGTWIVRVIPGC